MSSSLDMEIVGFVVEPSEIIRPETGQSTPFTIAFTLQTDKADGAHVGIISPSTSTSNASQIYYLRAANEVRYTINCRYLRDETRQGDRDFVICDSSTPSTPPPGADAMAQIPVGKNEIVFSAVADEKNHLGMADARLLVRDRATSAEIPSSSTDSPL